MGDHTTMTGGLRHGRPVTLRVPVYRLHVTDADGEERVETLTKREARIGSQPGMDITLGDNTVSRTHCEIIRDNDGFRLRDLGSKNGTYVDGYRVSDLYLRPLSKVRVGRCTLVFEPVDDDAEVLLFDAERFGPLVGRSTPMLELFATLQRVAPSDRTVLIEGDTGTGKELFATALHEASRRNEGPLVVFDCAAVPANLMESELFGHEKGAFTGATGRRTGHFEAADGGTLFLDELGELPLELQPKLLRAIEQREVRKVGSNKPKAVDVRVIAATNRDLVYEVNRRAFRADLYYRVAVIRMKLPALRERPEDVRPLVEHFIREASDGPNGTEDFVAQITNEAWAALEAHPWPGNVRELKNVVEQVLTLGVSDPAQAFIHALPGGAEERFTGKWTVPPPDSPVPVIDSTVPPMGMIVEGMAGGDGDGDAVNLERPMLDQKKEMVAEFEKQYLSAVLEKHGGNIARAAAAAGIDRMYFKRLCKKYGI